MTPAGENAGLLTHDAKVVGQDEMSSGSSVFWTDAGQFAVAPTAAEQIVSETVFGTASTQGLYMVIHMSCATLCPHPVPGVSVEMTFHTVCVLDPNTIRSRSRWHWKGVLGENAG